MSIFNIAWLIPLFPLLAFAAISLFTYRDRKQCHQLAIGGMTLAFVLSQIVFWAAVLHPVGWGERAFESTLIHWWSVGQEYFTLGVYIDPVTTVMLFTVPLVCLMIFIYSARHMNFGTPKVDPRYSHFLAYISLSTAGMLGIVVFNNLLTLFIFWEIMGLCSYLLIGFWHEKKSATQAGLQVFLVTKVGDLLFMLGLALLYAEVGSLAYRDVFSPETLERLALTPFAGTQFSMATVITLLLFGGTVGTSSQFPLHVWLPDAVEGPAPASALIQSATMAPAGVYLMARCLPLYTTAGGELQMVGIAAGAFTALFAALIATAQDDVRRVLAFSTVSQLGCMVTALGGGACVAGVFHFITHAFCKALLVLGTASITHGMEHRLPFDPHDVKNMGGLARRQPITYWTFVAGLLSLSGFPLLTTGFWSQERILNAAYENHRPVVFWVLAVTAGLTAFYATRLLCLIFLGQPRSEAAANAHESEQGLTAPLVVLAVFAVCLGWGGLFPDWFYRFVGNSQAAWAAHFAWQPLAISAGFTLGGLLVGVLIYGWKPARAGQMDRLEAGMRCMWLGWLYDALRHRFYFDELYRATFARGAIGLARACAGFDRSVMDGVVKFVAAAWRPVSRVVSRCDALAADRVIRQVAWIGRAVSKVAGHCETLGVDRVIRQVAWIGQAVSEVTGRLETLGVNRAANLVAWASRTVSEAAGGFEMLVADRAVNLVGRATRVVSELGGLLDPRVLDPIADAVGHATRAISDASGAFETRIVDGAVEGTSSAVRAGGRFIRPIQTDQVQNHVLSAFISILVLVAMYLTMVYFAWW